MRIHSTDGQSVVNYRYLADGSKFSATDDTGEGLVYIGSLVYRFRNGAYELDHAAFSQGFSGKIICPKVRNTFRSIMFAIIWAALVR